MPAITVDDVTELKRLPRVGGIRDGPSGASRRHRAGWLRRRRLPGPTCVRRRGPHRPRPVHPHGSDRRGRVAAGEPKGTPWHPHRGFETVTYMLDGIFEHQDSNGGGGVITNGDTQWMTAGAGILHIEKPPEHLVASGGLFTGSSSGSIYPRPRSGPLRATRISGGAR